MFGSWSLNEIWIIDLFWPLVSMSSSKVFLFFERSSFKLRCETVIGIVLCYSHQACCLLYYLCEINNGIHIYQFTFELLHFRFQMWSWFRIWTKILADRRIWRKKRHGSADLHTPIHPLPRPSCKGRVTQKLRNSSVVYHKTKNPFGAKICMNISFQLLL